MKNAGATRAQSTKSICIRIPNQQYRALEAIGEKDDRSINYLVNAAITAFLQKKGNK
jgi:predicted transcriptional regulator